MKTPKYKGRSSKRILAAKQIKFKAGIGHQLKVTANLKSTRK